MLPPKIILVRHAESEGNVDNFAYTYVPDPQVPLVRAVVVFWIYPGLARGSTDPKFVHRSRPMAVLL